MSVTNQTWSDLLAPIEDTDGERPLFGYFLNRISLRVLRGPTCVLTRVSKFPSDAGTEIIDQIPATAGSGYCRETRQSAGKGRSVNHGCQPSPSDEPHCSVAAHGRCNSPRSCSGAGTELSTHRDAFLVLVHLAPAVGEVVRFSDATSKALDAALEDSDVDAFDFPTRDTTRPIRKLTAAGVVRSVLDSGCGLFDEMAGKKLRKYLSPLSAVLQLRHFPPPGCAEA
jgi:hypothetical protein